MLSIKTTAYLVVKAGSNTAGKVFLIHSFKNKMCSFQISDSLKLVTQQLPPSTHVNYVCTALGDVFYFRS